MAGQFDPQTLQGSSLRGESFIERPVEAIDPSIVGQALNAGANVYGAHVAKKAQGEISQAQNVFLDELSAARSDIAQAEDLRDDSMASPMEKSVFDKYQSQIRSLEESATNRRINPSEAQARIESIKRKAIAQVPFFADKIRGLSGNRGATFDVETAQLIKETNDRRDEAVKRGLNPDNPSHMEMMNRHILSEQEAKFISSNKEVYNNKVAGVTSKLITNQIEGFEAQVQAVTQGAGGIDSIPEDTRSSLIGFAQGFTNGREKFALKQMVDENPYVDYSRLDQRTIENLEALLRGSAEAQIKVLDGNIPSGVTATQLKLATDRIGLNLAKESPSTFHDIALAGMVPPGSSAASTLGEVAAEGLVKYKLSKLQGGGAVDDLVNSGYSTEEARLIKDASADNLQNTLSWLKHNPKAKTDPDFLKAHFGNLTKELESASRKATQFTKKEHEAYLDYISSTDLLNNLKDQSPDEYLGFVDQAGQYVKNYAKEHLGADLRRELQRGVFSDTFAGTAKSGKVEDLVSASVSSNGVLQFIPNKGLRTPADERRASEIAAKLSSMYRIPSLKLSAAVKNVGNVPEGFEGDITKLLLGDVLGALGEPLRVEPEVIVPPEHFEFTKPVLSRDK